jgi:hypothetical protein
MIIRKRNQKLLITSPPSVCEQNDQTPARLCKITLACWNIALHLKKEVIRNYFDPFDDLKEESRGGTVVGEVACCESGDGVFRSMLFLGISGVVCARIVFGGARTFFSSSPWKRMAR